MKFKFAKASFNDIPFFVDSLSTSGGHNLRIYEYPGDELGQSKHLSIKLKKYTVNAYLVGKDCIRKRDALLSVLDDTSVGTLKHPTFGEIDCHAESYSIDESIGQEHDYIKININFIPSGSEDFFQAVKGYITEIQAFGDLIREKISVYRTKLGLINKPSGFSLQSIAIIRKYLNRKENQISKSNNTNSTTIRNISNSKANLSVLANNPVLLSSTIGDISNSISTDLSESSNLTDSQKTDLQRESKRALVDLDDFFNQIGSLEELFYYKFFGSTIASIEAANLSRQISEDGNLNIKITTELYNYLSSYLDTLSQTLYSLQASSESLYSDVFFSNEFDDIESSITDLRNSNFRLFNTYKNYKIYEATGESIITVAFKNYKNITDGISKIEKYNTIRDYSNLRGSILIP